MADKKKFPHGPRIRDKARKWWNKPKSSPTGAFGASGVGHGGLSDGLNADTTPYKPKPPRVKDKPRK